jgi:hypothetical protein
MDEPLEYEAPRIDERDPVPDPLIVGGSVPPLPGQ